MSTANRILIIEDDESIRRLIRMHLRMNGFSEVIGAPDGETGLSAARKLQPDLILLDIMLPGIDGLTVCRNLKGDPELSAIPVILLTAKGEESDIVLGLELGADDYVTKPFSSNVLLARIRVQLRRKGQNSLQETVSLGRLFLDASSRVAKLDGTELLLTADEFDTLLLLARSPDKVFTRRQIIGEVKGEDYPVTDRVVDIRMMKLRKKLGVWGSRLETVRGVGYKVTGENESVPQN